MKKFLLVMFAMLFTAGMAFAETVTITTSPDPDVWTGDANGYSYTTDGFTISYLKYNSTNNCRCNASDGCIRLYAGAKFTVENTSGATITQVVINFTASNYCQELTVDNGTSSVDTEALTQTWTGSTTLFEAVNNNSSQVRISSVVITYDGSGNTKQDAGLAFSETEISVKNGEEFTSPTFSKATTADVTFTTDNSAVATVDNNGVISLAGSLGTAVITASAEENDTYNAGTATCTITVYDVNTYKKATTITSGNSYLIVAQRDNQTMYAYPISESRSYGYMYVGTIDGLTETIEVSTEYDDSFVFTASGDGYTIQDCYDRYLYQSGTYNSFNVSATNDGYVWTVEPQSDGTFKIAMNGYYIQWGQGTYTSFGVYTEAQENAVMPYLYELTDTDGISSASVAKETKDDPNAPIYNLAGQRVSKDTKGILIQNGKKFINK